MTRYAWVAMASWLVACSSSGKSAPDASVEHGADAAVGDVDAGGGDATADFYRRAATAICGALYRCCNDGDVADYFAPYRNDERLQDFLSRLPPAAELDEVGCRAVVSEMLAVAPFGDWIDATRAGTVSFVPQAMDSCVRALDDASCGSEVRAALWDSTCLGYAAPVGGDQQRSMFQRTAGPGQACSPIRDGVGASFFGTCDPTAAFCCYQDPSHPELGCTLPYDGDTGATRPGECKAAAGPGQACDGLPPLALCRTGLDCDSDSGTCVAPADDNLSVGERCVDDHFNILGHCQDSYCDFFGTSLCEPRKADGVDCQGGDECTSGYCRDGSCSSNQVCTTTTQPPPPDAGSPDAGSPDAGSPDAGPDAAAATGETCADAFDLIGASVTDSDPAYDYQVADSFGASDDYNPLSSSGKPPACSIVYDASGYDRVYRVTLKPGQQLSMRLTVTPNSAPGGLYLLDDCGTGAWPDFDGSGACGSNEYKSQGYCGYLGCDPIELVITYPTQLNGVPTVARDFWVVVDQVGGNDATGYELEWTLSP